MRLIIVASALAIVAATAAACGRTDSAEPGRRAEAGTSQTPAVSVSDAPITVAGDTAFVKGVTLTVSKGGIVVKFPSSDKEIPSAAVTSWQAGSAFSIIYDDGKTPHDTHPGTLDDIQSGFFIPKAGEDINRVAGWFRKSLPAELEKK